MIRTYYGVNIYPYSPGPWRTNPGGFRWEARVDGLFVYAQTLADIRELIREGRK